MSNPQLPACRLAGASGCCGAVARSAARWVAVAGAVVLSVAREGDEPVRRRGYLPCATVAAAEPDARRSDAYAEPSATPSATGRPRQPARRHLSHLSPRRARPRQLKPRSHRAAKPDAARSRSSGRLCACCEERGRACRPRSGCVPPEGWNRTRAARTTRFRDSLGAEQRTVDDLIAANCLGAVI
jgi:hypothetical protein